MTVTEDFTILLDVFGEDVTATPGGGGAPESIRAVVDASYPNQEEHPERGGRFAMATITVSAGDWTPHIKDRFDAKGYNWEMAPEGWEFSTLNEDSTSVHKGNLIRLIS